MSEPDYSETTADPRDPEGRVLNALADGMPYAFAVATSLEPLNLRLATDHSLDTVRALLNQTLRALPGGGDLITDGYHSFGELYDHRRALTAALAKSLSLDSWRSKEHHPDGDPMFEGYFIVGINLPTGPITYHYKLSHWDDFAGVTELAHAPAWDGHTPADTVERMLAWTRAG